MKKKISKEPSKLNDYHQKRNEEGLKAVEEMLKHPLSLEQAKEQTRKFLAEIRIEISQKYIFSDN